jgi:hypothetical protein
MNKKRKFQLTSQPTVNKESQERFKKVVEKILKQEQMEEFFDLAKEMRNTLEEKQQISPQPYYSIITPFSKGKVVENIAEPLDIKQIKDFHNILTKDTITKGYKLTTFFKDSGKKISVFSSFSVN